MDHLVTILIGAAWLGILGMLIWGIVSGWREPFLRDAPLPLFRLLERDGLTLARAEEAVGVGELARAARRCGSCAARTACETGVLGGWLGRRPLGCPNASLFDRARNFDGAPR
jgi:hypothetical protein